LRNNVNTHNGSGQQTTLAKRARHGGGKRVLYGRVSAEVSSPYDRRVTVNDTTAAVDVADSFYLFLLRFHFYIELFSHLIKIANKGKPIREQLSPSLG